VCYNYSQARERGNTIGINPFSARPSPNDALDKRISRLEDKTEALQALVIQLIKVGRQILTDQEQLDADVAALSSVFDDIEAEIQKLKDKPAAVAIDFSKLEAIVARGKGDAANSAPTPDPTPAPADAPTA
jgi:small-conductance mechanosensitive channel